MTTKIEQLRSLLKQHDDLRRATQRVENEIIRLVPSYRTTAVSQARLKIKEYDRAASTLKTWDADYRIPTADLFEEEDEEDLLP